MNLPMLFVLIAGASALMGFYRLLAGPTATDRVVGLDLLFAVAIILSLTAAWISGRTVYLDVAIGLALVGFVATLSWARLIQVAAAGGCQDGAQVGAAVGGQGGSQLRRQSGGQAVVQGGSRGGSGGGDTWGDSLGSGLDQEGRS